MVTCLVDLFYPEVGFAAVRLLRRHGVGVEVPPGQTCCGLPLLNSGYRAEAARVARRTIALFGRAEAVVIPSGSCAWMVRAEYPDLCAEVPGTRAAAEALARRTWELSQFLGHLAGGPDLPAGPPAQAAGSAEAGAPVEGAAGPAGSGRRVTYHDSCHLLRGLGEAEAPRRLIRQAGFELAELPGAEECCGFGGSFAVRLPEVSGAMLRRKLERVRATGAEAVVTCDAGCLLQIAGGLRRAGDRVRALHLAALLAGGGGGAR